MKNKLLFVIILFAIMIIIGCLLFFTGDRYDYVIEYNGKKYVYLEYNSDIFTYGLNKNYNYEVDEIYPIEHDKWDIICLDGDLFVVKNQVREATKYYSDDKNYKWSFCIDVDDEVVEESITISEDELEELYKVDSVKKDKSIYFDEIEAFGSIKKTSKDGFISGITSVAYYNCEWYWKSEIMNDDDKEYIIELPVSLSTFNTTVLMLNDSNCVRKYMKNSDF